MAIPDLVQYSVSSCIPVSGGGDALLTAGSKFYAYLPNPSLSGNCLICAVKSEASATAAIAVTDDQGNTWTEAIKHFDSSNGASTFIWICANAAAGTRKISVQNTDSSSTGFFCVRVAEFCNIETSSNAAAIDGTQVGAHGTSAAPAAGSKTPSVSGCLVFQIVACDNGHASSYTAGSQANITWKLLQADRNEGNASQWGVYNSTSALSPTMTFGSSVGWCTAAVFLKSAAAGTAAPTDRIWVRGVHHFSMPTANGSFAISNPFLAQCPCVGNLLVGAYSSGSPNYRITAISDSSGKSWLQYGPGITNTAGGDPLHEDTCSTWYSPAHSASDSLLLTVNLNGLPVNDGTLLVYDISGAADVQNAPERSASATGTSNSAITSITTTTITPKKNNSLIVMQVQQETNTETGITSPSGALFDSNTYDSQDIDGPMNVDENGGWAHYYTTDLTAITATWSLLANQAMGNWAGYAAEFVAPPLRKIYRQMPHSQRAF